LGRAFTFSGRAPCAISHTQRARIYIVPRLRGEQESEISNSLPAIMKERGTMKEPRGLKLCSPFTQLENFAPRSEKFGLLKFLFPAAI
jgi:hypothetical protein